MHHDFIERLSAIDESIYDLKSAYTSKKTRALRVIKKMDEPHKRMIASLFGNDANKLINATALTLRFAIALTRAYFKQEAPSRDDTEVALALYRSGRFTLSSFCEAFTSDRYGLEIYRTMLTFDTDAMEEIASLLRKVPMHTACWTIRYRQLKTA